MNQNKFYQINLSKVQKDLGIKIKNWTQIDIYINELNG